MAKKRKQADNVADTRKEGWVGLPKCVIKSDAFRTLSYSAKSVLIEILYRFNGYNNGKIAASQAQLMAAIRTSSARTIVNAIAELMEHGLISISAEGEWKPRMARQFRITFISTMRGIISEPATNDYLHYRAAPRNGRSAEKLAISECN